MIDWIVALQRPWLLPKYRLINPFLPKTGNRTAKVYGATFDLDLSDLIQRKVFVGCYERNETVIFRRLLRPGQTLLDVGANIGYFTALGAQLVTSTGKVICVEPNPTAFKKLKAMIDRNKLSQCTPVNIGLSKEAGSITLFEPPIEHHNLNSTMVPTAGYKPIDVAIRTLDEILDEHGVRQVDLMKVDVEGHEPKVFSGGARSLESGKIRHILCEFNQPWLEQANSSSKALLAMLKDFGFDVISGAGKEDDLSQYPIVNLLLKKKQSSAS